MQTWFMIILFTVAICDERVDARQIVAWLAVHACLGVTVHR